MKEDSFCQHDGYVYESQATQMTNRKTDVIFPKWKQIQDYELV